MAGVSFRAAAIVALLAAALYQTFMRNVITRLGVGRHLEPIADFPYQCRRVVYDELQGCEDMWLDEERRQLYLACSNVKSRQFWMPNMGKLNESAAYMKDAIYVLDIDKPIGNKNKPRPLILSGYPRGKDQDGLHVLSVSGRHVPGSSKLELYLVNNKPSRSGSASASFADNSQTGANSTIELFEIEAGSSSMKHIRTFAHELIATPNNVAPKPDGSGFYITNDHGLHKTGYKHSLSPWIQTGNAVYCTNPPRTASDPFTCKVVAKGFSFPNGLAIHPLDPKILYIPSAGIGKGVAIFKIHPDGSLTKLQDLAVPYPIDNLSPSSDGSIYAAAMSNIIENLKHFDDEAVYDTTVAVSNRKSPPSAVLKIEKVRNLVNDGHEVTWTWQKILEDGEGRVLPMATTALRDAKTGRLFISGIVSYFMTICDQNAT